MKIIDKTIFEGRNIYSHKKCIRLDVDLEGYSEVPTKNIDMFNENLLKMVPELYKHRCGIDEEHGFVKRLEEGTYLAHVCEHTIIALQNMLGIDLAYGKAREVSGDHYYIIFQYQYKILALNIAYLAVDIVNSLIENHEIDFDKRYEELQKILVKEQMGASTKELLKAAEKRGLPYINIGDSGMYQIGYGRKGKVISATIGENTRCIGVDIACDKYLTKQILKSNFIPIADGEKVYNTLELIKYSERLGYPLVLKPQFGNKGNGVILNITNSKELIESYISLKKTTDDIIVEKYYEGKDYRVCLVDYKVVAVAKRIPPYVIGNGKLSLKKLLCNLNSDSNRGNGHEKPLTKVKIDDQLVSYLSEQGFNLNSVPKENERIFLRKNANLSTGAIAVDCTDEISDENKEICERAAKALGLDICGIDICSKDISSSLNEEGIIVEINAAPGIRMHHFPSEGKPRDVAGAIIDMIYRNNFDNIPVISVTGTNGKTTTTRLISYVFSRIGYNVGMTTTSGISVGGKSIDRGDDTGITSARSILLNKDVDIAVLETARGGIVRRGLAYDLADVAVLTNITEDHLGLDGIETMEDLSKAKALVVEAVKEDGFAVINADDKWSLSIRDRINCNIIYFSMDYENEFIQNNIKNNLKAVYYKDNRIYIFNNGRTYMVADIKDIPITLNGKLKYNIKNVMAACCALTAMNVDYCMISKGVTDFNERDNEGRFNIYNIAGVDVVLDYGHNIDGYNCVLESLKGMDNRKLVGVIGVPGDRGNDVIERIGKMCSDVFDKIYIKEDCDKRGRKNGEVADILLKGVRRGKCKNVKVVLDELDALKEAIDDSSKGDMVIEFYENFEKLSSYINEQGEYNGEERAQNY